MSLLIWLPLIEDTKNYGAGPNLSFSGSPTFIDGGKISKKCLNGANYIVDESTTIPQLLTTTNNYSMCAWIKTTATGHWNWSIGDGAGTTRGLWCDSNGAPHFAYSGSGAYSGSVVYADGQWHHICFTVKESNSRVYVDGVDCGGASNVKTDAVYGNRITLFQNYCSINDFRLYDHCLSAAEVHEIAQGLILHYKLNDPQPNLALGSHQLNLSPSKDNSNWGKRGAATLVNNYGFTVSQGTANWQGVACWANTLNLQVGTTYTISCMGYTNTSTNTNANLAFYPILLNSAGTRDTSSTMPISVMGGEYTEANSKMISKLTDVPVLYWASFVWNQTMANIIANGGSIELSLQVYGTFNDGDTHCLYAPKLEIGDVPTFWRGALSEEGLTINIIQDSSGYNNNGIAPVALALTKSVRYNCSMLFNGTNQYINCGDKCKVTDAITVSIWGYMNNWSTYDGRLFSCTQTGGWNLEPTDGKIVFQVGTGVSENSYNGATSNITFASLASGWHHFVGTFNGYNAKLYIDGELKQTGPTLSNKTPIFYNATNSILVGAEVGDSNTAVGNYFNGRLSDFRIYCTALLDNDVKMLYNVGMKIDNFGAIHTYEYIEENSEKLLHSAILKTNEMTENSNLSAKLIKNTGWQSSNFIEI